MEAWLLTKDRVIEVPVGRIPEEFVWKTPTHTQPQTQPSPAPRPLPAAQKHKPTVFDKWYVCVSTCHKKWRAPQWVINRKRHIFSKPFLNSRHFYDK